MGYGTSKVIFWDFDGTLVHPNERFVQTFRAAAACYNYDIPIDEIRTLFVRIYPWNNTHISYTDQLDSWWDRFVGNFSGLYEKHGISAEAGGRISRKFVDDMVHNNTYTLYEDTKAVLGECKKRGYRNYGLSNNYPELLMILDQFGLTEYFEEYIVSANVGYEKPRRELYDYAKSRAGKFDVGFMIGDNPIADIRGGNAAGLTTIFVHKDEVTEADYTCKTLTEALAILK